MFHVERLDDDLLETRDKALGSLLYFTQLMFKIRTGREFRLSCPKGRESHYIVICKSLTKVFKLETINLNINIPPRYGKTELLIHFIAWSLAHYPDSNFIYISYSHSLASRATLAIREILQLPQYSRLFGVSLKDTSQARDFFETTAGGSVYAAGSGGTITGFGAGVKGVMDRFSGCIVIDDAIKPDEAASDVVREGVIDNYYNTIQSRKNNGELTPTISIGQCVHEDDLIKRLKDDGFTSVILPVLDIHENPLDPAMHDLQTLKSMAERKPYVFAAQYQQDPMPAGGAIFKPEYFQFLEVVPDILTTFITADTAETSKTYNDPTVFSFWGVYKIKWGTEDSGLYGLHWLDCQQMWLEPKDLENAFRAFLIECSRHKVKPKVVAIEKKSTGSTLASIVSTYQGLQCLPIDRPNTMSKSDRFLSIQPIVANKQISLPAMATHTKMCVDHCKKITANNSHVHDDIADTLYDAVDLMFVKQLISTIFDERARQFNNEMVRDLIRVQNRQYERRSKIICLN